MANIKSFIALILTATISFSCGPSPEEIAETKIAQTAEFEVKLAAAIEQTMAAKPTMTAKPTPGRCDRPEYVAKSDSTFDIVDQFDSTREIAAGTGRGALAPVILQLDQIYREMNDLAVPECIQLYKAYIISYMESTIEAFKDFQIDGTQMDDWFAQALHALETSNELLEVMDAESLTGLPPDLMDLPGVPLPTDTLNFLQGAYGALLKEEVLGDITITVTVATWNSVHHNGQVYLDIHFLNKVFYGNDKMQGEVICPLALEVHETVTSYDLIDESYGLWAEIFGPDDLSLHGTMCVLYE